MTLTIPQTPATQPELPVPGESSDSLRSFEPFREVF